MLVHQLVEPVAAYHQLRVNVLKHVQQLLYSHVRSLGADVIHCLDDSVLFEGPLGTLGLAHGVIAFSGFAKQSTQQSDVLFQIVERKAVYCLAPASFLASRLHIRCYSSL